MDFDSLGDIIATRRFYFLDDSNTRRSVSVLVGKPQPSTDSPGYNCPFQVIGIGSQKTEFARGRDSIDALQAAMIMIAENLKQLSEALGRGLIWDVNDYGELGFRN